MTTTTPLAAAVGPTVVQGEVGLALVDQYRAVRGATETLAAPLSPEDCCVQSMTDCSPTKWHLAHTTWFFEAIVLGPHLAGYRDYHPQFAYLFNSYYNTLGERVARPSRGLMTRPSLDEVYAYRRHVDRAMEQLFDTADDALGQTVDPLITIGLNHEQQHQELLLTDVKHLLAQNPLGPIYQDRNSGKALKLRPVEWMTCPGGVHTIGHAGEGFAYDNEGPRHEVLLRPFALASRPTTNGEYIAFVEDGGYREPTLWLDAGWAAVNEHGWEAPGYWQKRDGQWWQFTLAGMQQLIETEPVTHLSYFEADAFARWMGRRLPTEAEWEVASRAIPDEAIAGNFAETRRYHPATVVAGEHATAPAGMFGDVWEWTQSHYSPYPGYRAEPGPLGEYNGKFMCGQFVLRGGSCATPVSHIRRTYRNFWGPDKRFQFSGVRLAEDRS